MGTITDTELKNNIKAGKFDNVYLFYGKNVFAIEQSTKQLVSKLIEKDSEAYNLHKFEGKSISLDELSDASESLPFFSDHLCCTICDLNCDSLSADQIKQLSEILSGLPETSVVVIYDISVDITDGKRYPTAKNKKIVDLVSKIGTVCCFLNKTSTDLSKDIITKVSKNNCSISKKNAVYLADLCLCNAQIISNEIDKLVSYAENSEITLEMINQLCPKQIEAAAFDLAKAIVKRDRKKAVILLKDLLDTKVEPITILYAITSNILDLYRARVAINNRKSIDDVSVDFNYPKNMSFRVGNAFRDVTDMSVSHLRECMSILTLADISMKSLKTDKQILLEEAIIRMMSSN